MHVQHEVLLVIPCTNLQTGSLHASLPGFENEAMRGKRIKVRKEGTVLKLAVGEAVVSSLKTRNSFDT